MTSNRTLIRLAFSSTLTGLVLIPLWLTGDDVPLLVVPVVIGLLYVLLFHTPPSSGGGPGYGAV